MTDPILHGLGTFATVGATTTAFRCRRKLGDALSVKTKGMITMRMRQVLAAAALTVGGVAASGTPALASTNVERPFKSMSSGTIINDPCNLGPTGAVCDQAISTTFIATHLGRSSNSATGVLTIDFAAPCTPSGGGNGFLFDSTVQHTVVAANGDELYATTAVSGCADLGGGLTEPVGTYTITGGTGRFSGATGGGDVFTTVIGEAFASTWTGTLSY